MGVSGEAVGAMQAYLRLKRYILPSGIAREALTAAAPHLAAVQVKAELALYVEKFPLAKLVGEWPYEHDADAAFDTGARAQRLTIAQAIRDMDFPISKPSAGRAAALEEAARWHEAEAARKRTVAVKSKRLDAQIATHEASAAHFRALHPQADKPSDDGAQGEGWLPIESAPKDGAAVLVYFVQNEVPSLNPLICAAYWQQSDGLMKPGFWRLLHSVGPSFTATRWRPLPTPPAGEVA